MGVDAAVAMDRAEALLGLAELSEASKQPYPPHIHIYTLP